MKKLSTSEYKIRLASAYGNEFTLVSEYNKLSEKVEVIHNTLKPHKIEILPQNLIKRGCSLCGNKRKNESRKISKEEFKERVFKQSKDDYTFLEDYKGIDTKIKVVHNLCNHEYFVSPNKFFQGTKCPKCQRVHQKTDKEFKNEIFNLVGDEYTILSEYTSTNNKVKIKHNICNHEYTVSPNNFINGNKRCLKCSNRRSKSEERIENFFKDNKIEFDKEKTFSDCYRERRLLPFDFYIPSLNILIEYDGEYHFHKLKQTKEEFLRRKENDKIKNEFCLNKNINLLRISYREKNTIEQILEKEVLKHE